MEVQNKQRAEYKDKVSDERKRIKFLTKEINAMETEMVNTAGYRRIYDLEAERKNLKKEIDAQLAENESLQNVFDKHSKVFGKEKDKVEETH